MSGLGEKFKGSIKEAVGEATDNDKLQAEGKKDQIVGNVKDSVEQKTDEAKDAVGEKTNDLLDKVKDKTENDE